MAENKNLLILRPIGFVENSVNERLSPEEIKAVESRIVVKAEFQDGLRGITAGREVLVAFFFHLSQGYTLIQHPRGDETRPAQGVFALRSPNRPNPIGVTIVHVDRIEGNVLTVHGLDAINGTPILDLKLEGYVP